MHVTKQICLIYEPMTLIKSQSFHPSSKNCLHQFVIKLLKINQLCIHVHMQQHLHQFRFHGMRQIQLPIILKLMLQLMRKIHFVVAHNSQTRAGLSVQHDWSNWPLCGLHVWFYNSRLYMAEYGCIRSELRIRIIRMKLLPVPAGSHSRVGQNRLLVQLCERNKRKEFSRLDKKWAGVKRSGRSRRPAAAPLAAANCLARRGVPQEGPRAWYGGTGAIVEGSTK